jgi:hypothetical protein
MAKRILDKAIDKPVSSVRIGLGLLVNLGGLAVLAQQLFR